MSDIIRLVSIIVPIYNVESYLEKCIVSILNQSYQNFELILVNDGSPDNSEKICKKYLTDDRVHYYKKKNGGLSDARNFGLSKASGSHVMFVDSDDYLHRECLQTLVDLFENDVQISCIGQCRVKPHEERQVERGLESGTIDGVEALRCICIRKHLGTSAWGKLYNIHLFDKIKFPVGKIHEDIWTIPYIVEKASTVAYDDSPFYFYVQQNDSIMHRPLSQASYKGFCGLNKLVKYVYEKYPSMCDEVICRWINDFFGDIMNRLVFQNDYYEKATELRRHYKKYFDKFYLNKYLNTTKKTQCILFLYCLPLLKTVMKIYLWNRNA